MPKKIPKILSQEEFELLYKMARVKKGVPGIELRIAMLLGFEAGMRISEIVGYLNRVPPLTKDKIEDASIRIESGKGKKDRIVPRPKRLHDGLKKFFPLKINRRTLQRQVTVLGKIVLGKDITFHTLRHGFGSHLAQTRPLHEVQMLMGHSRLDTTGVYLHANPKQAIDGARDVF